MFPPPPPPESSSLPCVLLWFVVVFPHQPKGSLQPEYQCCRLYRLSVGTVWRPAGIDGSNLYCCLSQGTVW